MIGSLVCLLKYVYHKIGGVDFFTACVKHLKKEQESPKSYPVRLGEVYCIFYWIFDVCIFISQGICLGWMWKMKSIEEVVARKIWAKPPEFIQKCMALVSLLTKLILLIGPILKVHMYTKKMPFLLFKKIMAKFFFANIYRTFWLSAITIHL